MACLLRVSKTTRRKWARSRTYSVLPSRESTSSPLRLFEYCLPWNSPSRLSEPSRWWVRQVEDANVPVVAFGEVERAVVARDRGAQENALRVGIRRLEARRDLGHMRGKPEKVRDDARRKRDASRC